MSDQTIDAAATPIVPRRAVRWWPVLGWFALTLAGLSLAFPPFDLWPLGLFALAPWAWCVITQPARKRMVLASWGLGFVYFGANLYWLWPITSGGEIALSAYLGLYFALAAWGLRRIVVTLRWPVWLALPLVWVTAEYLRGTIMTGFAWFFLGSTLAPATVFLQIADGGGVWALSLLCALVAGGIVDLFRFPLRKGERLHPALLRAIAAVASAILLTVFYGIFRLHQRTVTPGPTVAVVQSFVPQRVKDMAAAPATAPANFGDALAAAEARNATLEAASFTPYLDMSYAAAAAHPDLIVWPETEVPGEINDFMLSLDPARYESADFVAFLKMSQANHRALITLSDKTGAHLLVGAEGEAPGPDPDQTIRQNLAIEYAPGAGQVRPYYAKRHLVPVGEYIPFPEVPWFHKFLLSLTPIDFDYSTTPGDAWRRFAVRDRDGAIYKFGTPICYEDVMPDPARQFVAPVDGRKQVDFLVSISNDGWYESAGELAQHLALDQIRAVENRTPVARSVNGGLSGFVDSNGRVGKIVSETAANGVRTTFQARGFAVQQLAIDSRVTVYSRFGDWLPVVTGIITAMALGWSIVRPRRGKPMPAL
jgi:apolipoprotein N-acyltransferase